MPQTQLRALVERPDVTSPMSLVYILGLQNSFLKGLHKEKSKTTTLELCRLYRLLLYRSPDNGGTHQNIAAKLWREIRSIRKPGRALGKVQLRGRGFAQNEETWSLPSRKPHTVLAWPA